MYQWKETITYRPSTIPVVEPYVYHPGFGSLSIGSNAISLDSNFYEWQLGFRYLEKAGPVQIEFGFLPGVGRITMRDLHTYRLITFRAEADGFSLYTHLSISYVFDKLRFGLNFFGHRLYTRGHNESKGWSGIDPGMQVYIPVDLNFKENGTEFSIGYAL